MYESLVLRVLTKKVQGGTYDHDSFHGEGIAAMD